MMPASLDALDTPPQGWRNRREPKRGSCLLAARALLRLEQAALAEAAGVARTTVIDFEAGARTPRPASVSAIRSALEAAGVVFIEENGGGPGVRSKA